MLVGACKFSNKCRKSWAYSNSVFFSVMSLLNRHDFFLIWNWISGSFFPNLTKLQSTSQHESWIPPTRKWIKFRNHWGLGPTSMTPSSKRFSDQRQTFFFAGPRKSLTLFVFSWCHDLFSSHLRAGSMEAKKGEPLIGPFWISGYPHYFGELKSNFKSLLEWETPSWKSSAS